MQTFDIFKANRIAESINRVNTHNFVFVNLIHKTYYIYFEYSEKQELIIQQQHVSSVFTYSMGGINLLPLILCVDNIKKYSYFIR